MKYMVMECHLSYAVVLDEDGRFLKVANMHYDVGQMVTDVVEMNQPQSQVQPAKKSGYKWIYSIAAMAACLMLIFTGVYRFDQMIYASVYMTINPEVRIDVNRNDVVVGLDGINADGTALVEDYNYKNKNLDVVMDELVDRAIDMGYLHEGGQITLTLDTEDGEWIVSKSDAISTHLNEHLTERMSVTIEVTNYRQEDSGIIIPVTPGTDMPADDYSESDYGETTPPSPVPESSSSPAVVPETSVPSTDSYNDPAYDDGQTDYGENAPDTNQSDYGNSSDDDQSDYGDIDDDDDEGND